MATSVFDQRAALDRRMSRSELRFDIVHSDAIKFFDELVREMGGEPYDLLRQAHIDPDVLGKRGSVIEYRSMVNLFAIAAAELRCSDFGMRLAALQGGTRVMGPIGVVMKSSQTLGQALGYCAKKIHAYNPATRVRFVPDRENHTLFLKLEIRIDPLPRKEQVVEHGLLLGNVNAIDITGGAARAHQVSFQHAPLSDPSVGLSFTQVAAKLGYAEQSVLSRSCFRWFGASPRELRERSLATASAEMKAS
jgi:AraC-like DNA-binding protein